MEHSPIGPSQADMYVACPATVQLCQRFPALKPNQAAVEGTAAHWVAWSMATVGVPRLGSVTPEGVTVTEEMLEGALLYCNAVFAVANRFGGMTRVQWEVRSAMPSLHPQMFGTCDARLNLLNECGELHYWEYKFGHLEVEEWDNYQLSCHARGHLEELGLDGFAEQHVTVVFHVVQPRCYSNRKSVRSWSCKASDLRNNWNIIRAAAHEALSDNPSYKVGSHCRYCDGARACPALRRNAGAVMDYAGIGAPQEMDPISLGLELRQVRRAKAVLEAHEQALSVQAEHLIRNGQTVPYSQIGFGRGKRVWTIPEEKAVDIGRMLGVNLAKPLAAVTPNQAGELLKKSNLDAAVIDSYSQNIPGAARLEASDESAAAKVFSQPYGV